MALRLLQPLPMQCEENEAARPKETSPYHQTHFPKRLSRELNMGDDRFVLFYVYGDKEDKPLIIRNPPW